VNNAGVFEYKDAFYGERGQLGDEDTAESIGDGGINADKRKRAVKWLTRMELYAKILSVSIR
jgi:hypothetical protein